MADLLTIVVRYAHILSAILWIGALGFSDMVLAPAVAKLSIPTRKETFVHLIPIANRFIPRVAIATIVFGTLLYLLMGNFDPAILFGSTWGMVILTALVLALGLLTFGLLVVLRTSKRILGHLKEEACSHGPEMGKLQKIFARGQIVALVWGFVILGLMVYATGGL